MHTVYSSRRILILVTLCASIFCLPSSSFSQSEPYNITRDRSTGRVTFLEPIATKTRNTPSSQSALVKQNDISYVIAADSYIKKVSNYFGIQNLTDLIPTEPTTDELGMSRVKYHQQYNGIPVIGGELLVHFNKDGAVTLVNGEFASDISISTKPKFSAEAAVKLITKNQKYSTFRTIGIPTLVIWHDGIVAHKANSTARLAWQIRVQDISTPGNDTDELIYIDASTGVLFNKLSNIRHLSRQVFDCTRYPIIGGCSRDNFSSQYNYYFGRSEGRPVRGPNPVYGGNDVDNMYDYFGAVDSYWFTKFNRDGANKVGGTGDGSVYAANLTRSFTYMDPIWPTLCPHALWSTVSKAVQFCRGMITKDIVGHEYAHAVSWYSFTDASGVAIGNVYQGETGAIEEGAADLYGEALEFSMNGSNDWKIGVGSSTGTIRDLANPPSLSRAGAPFPDRFNSPNFYCGTDDYGGVHYNATVIGKAFYLMAMGGKFNGCTISAVGRDVAEKVYYRALTTYFTRTTTFNGAYTAINLACKDLYHPKTCLFVQNALEATEMNLPGRCSGATRQRPTCQCPSSTNSLNRICIREP